MNLTPEHLDTMSVAEFQEYLPELFEAGGGSISKDPRFATFFAANPDCAALVSDLETIAEQARSLFEPVEDPSDDVWSAIASKLKNEPQERDSPGDIAPSDMNHADGFLKPEPGV